MAKVSKATVHYGMAKRSSDRCALCVHFRAPSSCTEVQGDINHSGWCDLFKAKKAKT